MKLFGTRRAREQTDDLIVTTRRPFVQGEPQQPTAGQVGLKDAIRAGWYGNDTDEMFTDVPIRPTDTVVDVGCGSGAASTFIAKRAKHLVAVDHNAEALAQARKSLENHGPASTEFIRADAADLPLPDDLADTLICREVLEHVESPAAVLQELRRVTKPGGLLLVTVPDPQNERMQKHVAPDSYFQPPNHIRIIEREEFAELITDADLEIIRQSSWGFFWSIWFALFWNRGVEFDEQDDPVLNHWTMAWQHLLDTPGSEEYIRRLDDFMPKSQVIVARKPE